MNIIDWAPAYSAAIFLISSSVSRISWICAGSSRRPSMIRLPSVTDRSRMRPRCRASSAKAVTVLVKHLVETTQTSGPAWTYTPPSASRAMAEPTTFTTPRTRAPLRLSSWTAASTS
ncbi:hypothetical protein SNARM312S_04263 [Streptomyces narbonensis]